MKHGQAGVAGNLVGFVAGESGGKPHALQTLRAKPGEPSRPSNLSLWGKLTAAMTFIDIHRNSPMFTEIHRNSAQKNKKYMSRERYPSARSGRYNPAGLTRAWGWQNEAETKPFRGGNTAETGRLWGGFMAQNACFYDDLSGLAGFGSLVGGPGKITERSHFKCGGWGSKSGRIQVNPTKSNRKFAEREPADWSRTTENKRSTTAKGSSRFQRKAR